MARHWVGFAVLWLLVSACPFADEEHEQLTTIIRQQFAKELQPLPPLNFEALIGRQLDNAEVQLGRLLFNDPIISRNNDTSCATCHLTNHGLADGLGLSVGALGVGGPNGDNVGRQFAEGTLGDKRAHGDDGLGFVGMRHMFRNTLTTINVAYRMDSVTNEGLLHDGRFGDLSFQVLLPVHTPEELCGTNPIPSGDANPYRPGGKLFHKPVMVSHSHSHDPYTGRDTGAFNAKPQAIAGIPDRRDDGSVPVPNRNECLAIAVAKIRAVPEYRRLFKAAFASDEVSDILIGRALAAFIMTHVADDAPYDRFVAGRDALTKEQMLGLALFFSPPGEKFELAGISHTGAGCVGCHRAPTFGGKGFVSLGVRSDPRSSLARPQNMVEQDTGFFSRERIQRGTVPACHIAKVTVNLPSNYAPDIGRANASFQQEDCFKFRIPQLRNVIETYPYFHHGTERAQGLAEDDFARRAYLALKRVVQYHLRGPVSVDLYNRRDFATPFFDDFYQHDYLVPFYTQNFNGFKPKDNNIFPLQLSDGELSALVDFVAYGLWDKTAVSKGVTGLDISHPKNVPSGFHPTINRDQGTQLELPPNGEF